MNYKQLYAIKSKNEKRILEVCPNCPNTSGIYFLLREENGFKFAYIGQSVHIRQRLTEHLCGFQHVDLSLKKHGFYSEQNPTGYKVHFLEFPRDVLDEKEQYYIKKYADASYQLKNSTSGSQGEGKKSLDNQRPSRGYYDGIAQGEKKAREYVRTMFEKYLNFEIKGKPNKVKERKLKEFEEWLNGEMDKRMRYSGNSSD